MTTTSSGRSCLQKLCRALERHWFAMICWLFAAYLLTLFFFVLAPGFRLFKTILACRFCMGHRKSWLRWVCNPSKLQWDSAGLLSRPCISALTGWMPYQLRIWHVLCCSLGASIEGSNRIILLYPAMRSVLWQASLLDRPARVKVRPNILQLAVQLTGEGFCLRHSASLLTPDISWHLLTSLDISWHLLTSLDISWLKPSQKLWRAPAQVDFEARQRAELIPTIPQAEAGCC